MNIRRILQFNFTNGQYFRRKLHKFATSISVTNDLKNVGQQVTIQGWVKALRKMKGNIFLDVNDGTSCQHLQVVLKKDNKIEHLSYGCSIKAEGEISLAPNGRPELHAEKISVIGKCELEGYPFLPRKQYPTDYIRQYLHLRPRTKTFGCTMRLRDLASNAIRDYFRNHDFIYIHTPILTSNDCEGAGELFSVQPKSKEMINEMKKEGVNDDEAYFNTKAMLTVSGQLHLEVCARALTKVYNFGPTFRAENSKSKLHLSEFYMIEAEIAFLSNLKFLAAEIEVLVKSVTMDLVTKGALELKEINAPDPSRWLERDFGYITYEEAVAILEKHSDKLDKPVIRGDNLTKEQELFLVQHLGDCPLFIGEWPKEIKAFYMKSDMKDPTKVLALDLLAPRVGELVGGSVREDSFKQLESKLPPNSNLDWYLELRKYGNVPTAGFGMGFERYLQFILGISNIKDVIPFPRWPHNCTL